MRRLFIIRENDGPCWLKYLPNPVVADVGEADLIVVAGMPYRTAIAAKADGLPCVLDRAIALTWRHIAKLNADGSPMRRLFIIRENDGPCWLKYLPNPVVEDVGEADLIVVAGMPYRTAVAAKADGLPSVLDRAIALRLPMVIADSDETYPQNGVIRLGPGWIAWRYIELGGDVIEFGKPYAPIYEAAAALCGGETGKIIMVGDNLATDVTGACRMGFASLLVQSGGVHDGLSPAELRKTAKLYGAWPTYIAPAFIW